MNTVNTWKVGVVNRSRVGMFLFDDMEEKPVQNDEDEISGKIGVPDYVMGTMIRCDGENLEDDEDDDYLKESESDLPEDKVGDESVKEDDCVNCVQESGENMREDDCVNCAQESDDVRDTVSDSEGEYLEEDAVDYLKGNESGSSEDEGMREDKNVDYLKGNEFGLFEDKCAQESDDVRDIGNDVSEDTEGEYLDKDECVSCSRKSDVFGDRSMSCEDESEDRGMSCEDESEGTLNEGRSDEDEGYAEHFSLYLQSLVDEAETEKVEENSGDELVNQI